MEIVRHLLDEFKPAHRYLSRHGINSNKRISENALNGALKRLGYQERDWTTPPHIASTS